MQAFLHAYCYKYQVFAITDAGDIYRIWFNGFPPQMERLFGTEAEYYGPITVLRALRDAYR